MSAYYNEHDPQAAAWLRELINAGLIAPGEVDERSIADVRADDVAGFRQCHWFAGVGGWSYALRLAGWPDDRPAWTGSCPCQPFSAAGKRKGAADERHLWPAFWWLIAQCRPAICFGEQVASKAGRDWLAGVRADLEALGYAVGAADLCAAGVGAPHIRQRLWWVADSEAAGPSHGGAGAIQPEFGEGGGELCRLADATGTRRDGPLQQPEGETRHQARVLVPSSNSADGRLEHPASDGWGQRRAESGGRSAAGGCGAGELGDTPGEGRQGRQAEIPKPRREPRRTSWDGTVWLPCADGKARRIGTGIEPLVDGLPGRVGLLRGYGNAIVPQVAAAFVAAFMDVIGRSQDG